MNRRAFLQTMAGATAVAAPAIPRPNIVVIMADDMGFSDLGCYGGEIATPHIDGLARSGLRFTQFYNTARCCPTRATLLSRLYSHQAGIGHMMEDRKLRGYRGDLSRNCVTIAEVLGGAGYRTAISGKWHVTPVNESRHNWPLQRGFEKFYGTIHGAGSFYDPVTLTRDNTPIEPDKPDYYYTDAITEKCGDLHRRLRSQTDPLLSLCRLHGTSLAHARPGERNQPLPRPLSRWLGCVAGGAACPPDPRGHRRQAMATDRTGFGRARLERGTAS
jgi:arylsulfatase A-like enzyme